MELKNNPFEGKHGHRFTEYWNEFSDVDPNDLEDKITEKFIDEQYLCSFREQCEFIAILKKTFQVKLNTLRLYLESK